MKKIVGVVLFLGGIAFSFASAHAENPAQCDFRLEHVSKSASDFTTRLASGIVGASQGQNVIIPSTAIHSLMTMVMLGTGETSGSRAELAKALAIADGTPSEQIVDAYGKALTAMRANGNGVDSPIVRLANAVFVSPQAQITDHYGQAITSEFGAQVVPATPQDLDKVNKIVSDTTDGKIKQVLKSLNPNMRIVLVSASYVKGAWVLPWKKSATRPGLFHPTGKLSAESYDVDMMGKAARYGFGETGALQVIELPLKGPKTQNGRARYSTLLLVPKGDLTPYDVLKLSQDEFAAVFKTINYDSLTFLQTPKFGFEWEGDLIPPLQNMGVSSIFGNADFSNLVTNPRNLYVSQIKSVGFIEFDEAGVAGGGAAAAEVSFRGMGPSVHRTVTVDRPFVVVVRDNELQIPLLQAAVFRPNPSSQKSAVSAPSTTAPVAPPAAPSNGPATPSTRTRGWR